jgi:hypothetical protein
MVLCPTSSIDAIQLLASEIPQPRHKAIAQQVTEPEQLFGKTVGIGEMLARAQDGVLFQQPSST